MKYRLISEPNKNYNPMQQILVNRGIEAKDIERYIKADEKECHSPDLLDNIDKGVERLLSAVEKDEAMFLIVDCDADGFTSSATLLNYLYKAMPECLPNIVVKLHEGKDHGIEERWIDEIIENKIKLVICPDSSSNNYEEHRILKENGIDVLILDHHEADKVSEDAIVVNNQLSDYPNKALSAVGIVYKFCKKLDEKLNLEESDNFLDLVALGNIADMMDVRSFETKYLIQVGLSNIQNPFFKALVERQSYSIGDSVTPIGVAFYIAPLINATIRMGTQEEKEVMFKAMLSYCAYEKVPSTKRGEKGKEEAIITQAVRNSINVRNRQKKYRDEGFAYVEKLIEENNLLSNELIIAKVSNELNKNLTGLIANKLMAKYQKPVLLIRETEGGVLRGSARGYDKSELKDLKSFLVSSGLMDYAEGHASAMGVGIKEENLDSLIEYSNKELEDIDFTACYDVDYIYLANDLNKQDVIDIASMKSLWGKGLDESMIVIKGVKVTSNNLQLMSRGKNPTLKITLPNGVSMIKFGSSEEEYNSLLSDGFVDIDVVGTASINEWQGMITPQILLKEYEIVKKVDYYF